MAKTTLYKRKIVALEQVASNSSKKLSIRQKKLLEQKLNAVAAKLDEVIVASQSPATLALSMKQMEFTKFVRDQFAALTQLQIPQIDNLLKLVYNNSRAEISNMLGVEFDITNEFQYRTLINLPTDGGNFSTRIYKNNAAIAERINSDIARLLYQKASPTDLKKALTNDFNMSYNAADRLIRTEASKFYNNAAQDSYKAAGITEIEWLTEEDDRTCEICGPLDGKRFPIGTINAPAHPNCRCAILPVIED